jgi:enoyl-CoA hydratase/carnithine racemase
MADIDVTITRETGALEITLDRAPRKNALSLAMYDALAAALAEASADAAIRAVLIKGSGGVFTSGNDLQDFMRSPPSGSDSPVFRFLEALVAFEKPLVAAVEGHAIGIGTTMLLHCDLVYAADSARFALPFVNLALVPEASSSFLLPRLMGHARAAELLFLGEPFDATTAKELGIVNAVFPAGDVVSEARKRVHALTEKPPEALRQTKRLLKAPLAAETRARMQAEGALFVERLASKEVAEAITAFFEKRRPVFGGG